MENKLEFWKQFEEFTTAIEEKIEARVMREVIEIIKVPEDKVVNVMELAIRNDILEQLLNNLKGIK